MVSYKNARSKRYPAKIMTDTDYADDLLLLANTLALAKPLLHSLEQAASVIGLYADANKTGFMCLKHKKDPSSL